MCLCLESLRAYGAVSVKGERKDNTGGVFDAQRAAYCVNFFCSTITTLSEAFPTDHPSNGVWEAANSRKWIITDTNMQRNA